MTTVTPRRGRDLSKIALQVATEASRLVLAGFRQNPTVSYKAHEEPYTEFDVKSEQLVRERLAELTPEIPVVGEEQGGAAAADLTWFCDPIDGTVNFMRGQPFFAVSLGVARAGVPFAGAVVAPALRMWWRGSTDDRAFRCEAPCQTSETSELGRALITTGLPVRGRPAERSGIELVAQLAPAVRDLRRCGSAAVELCMVADGTYDAYFTHALSPWDTVAGAAIVMAAGGTFERWEHASGSYEIACAPALRSVLLERLSAVPTHA
ncbi:MAG TPA: inositol monophosphatase [Polyangiaceae bacterium]|jgi:myo-inositol-1(or 4)-monophosphatase|nr:inositol monophosphatase [Polyangiaceae bacterium]